MIRTFELAEVKGTWSTLEIRKHRIQLISDSITEDKYTDSVSLSTVADQYNVLPGQIKTLEQKEQEEVVLLQEKSDLEYWLALLASGDIGKELAAQRTKVEQLLATKTQEYSNYQTELDLPFNYFCKISLVNQLTTQVRQLATQARQRDRNRQIQTIFSRYTTPSVLESLHSRSKPYLHAEGGTEDIVRWSWGQDWQFIKQDNGCYKVKLKDWKDNKPYLHAEGGTEDIVRWSWGQDWQFIKQDNGCYKVKLKDWKDNKPYLHAQGSTENIIRWSSGQDWQLTKQERSNKNIEDAQTKYNNANQEYQREKEKLSQLQEVFDADENHKAIWQSRLAVVKSNLTSVQNALNDANNRVITTVSTTQQTPQVLPILNTVSSGSQKGLVTKGALLGFASPDSRITAIETCEGNVQLSYFDNQGRMRLTNYDATADSNNTTFEEWVADELPVCLNLANDNDKVQLEDFIFLEEESTIEA